MIGHVGPQGGHRDEAVGQRRGIGGGLFFPVHAAGELKDQLLGAVRVRDIVLVESGGGLRDDANALGPAPRQKRDVDVHDVAGVQGQEPAEHGEAVFRGRVEVHRVLGGHADGGGGDSQKGGFHRRRHRAGVVDVDADVGPAVDAGHDQVDRTFVELHAGQLHAVGGRALHAEAGEQTADLDLRAGQRLVKRDAVAGAGPALRGRYNHHVAEIDQPFVEGSQTGSKDPIIIRQTVFALPENQTAMKPFSTGSIVP